MKWLLESLLGDKGDMGLLQGQLTHTLACKHCSSDICLQSPGNMIILFLFMVWQIRRWWQLVGWQQLQPWCSGDKMTQGKGLLYHLVFSDCPWKQNSEEEEEDEEKKEEESLSLDPLKPYYPSGFSTAPWQPSCSSQGLPRATETREQVLTQPPSPSRFFPTLQTLTGSSLQQKKKQLFWGLPSIHSESLETDFLSSDYPSSLKLSICPSVFYNEVPFLCVYNLLLPYYNSTYYPTPKAHTLEDLEKIAPGSQLVQSPPSPPIPRVSSNLKPLLKGCKRIIPDTKAHTQWFTQNKEVPCVSENQALYPQPKLQKIRSSTLLYSLEACREMAGDLSLYQQYASLLYPSNPQEVLDRFEMPWIIMKQNEHPKASETAMQTASRLPTSQTECQRVNPTGDLSQLKTLWETTVQKENPQIYEGPISDPCQFTVPMTEGNGPPGTPPGYEAQWGITLHNDIPQAFDPLMSASYQPTGSMSEVKNVNPKERLSAPKDFRENMGYRENPPVPKPPVSVPYPPLDTLEHQKESPLEDVSGFKPQWQYKKSSSSPWGFETPTLDSNMGFYETNPMCVPLGSATQLKGTPSTENLYIYASSPSLPSVSLPDFAIMGPQRVLLESKALWEIKEQEKHLWVSDSPCPHIPPLVPFTEPQRINTVDDFPRSEATGNNNNTKNCLSSEPPFLNLNPCPALVQQTLRVSPIESPFKSKAWCGDSQAWCRLITQRKSNFLASELPAQSLSQHLLGHSPAEVFSDFEPAGGFMKQNENHCVSVSPVWGSSSPPNSVLKFHVSEPSGDQCNYKPMKSVGERTKDSWASDLPAPSFFSALLQELHSETEFVCRNELEREASQGPNPPVVNPLQPTAWPIQPGLQKEGMFSEAKAEAPSFQGEAVSVSDHPVIHAWQWSRELKLRLKKLQHSSTFKSPDSHNSFYSSQVLNESLGLSFCPQQTHPLSLHPCSSSSHFPKVQRAEALPVQAPHCFHSSSQPQVRASGRAEQESQKNKMMKWKTMVQIPSPGHGHMKADEKFCSGMGDPSNTGVQVSGKRHDKTLVLLSTQQRRSSRTFKAEKCEKTARLGSPTVTRKNKPAQVCRPAEASIPRFSKRAQYRVQRSPHSALAQELLPNAASPQDQQRIGLVAGDTQNPCPCQHCPGIPLKQQLPSSLPKAPPSRGFQKLLDKFLRVHRPLPTKFSR